MRLKRRTWAYICAFMLIIGAGVLGAIVGKSAGAAGKGVCIALLAGIAGWLILDAVLMIRMNKAHLSLSALREEIDRKKKAIEADPEQERRRIARKALLVRALHALAILIVLAMVFFCAQACAWAFCSLGLMLASVLLPELICVYFGLGALLRRQTGCLWSLIAFR